MSSVCRSVHLSVTLVDQEYVDQDHISWTSWKLIARTISPTPSLFVAQRPSTYSQGNIGEILGDYRGVVGKVTCCIPKATMSLKRAKIEESYYGGPIGIHQRSFERYHPRPPTASSSPRFGVHNPRPKLQSPVSQEMTKLRTSNLAGTFRGSIQTKAH